MLKEPLSYSGILGAIGAAGMAFDHAGGIFVFVMAFVIGLAEHEAEQKKRSPSIEGE